eukprot:2299158-Pyramimonas_sp.AAC.1
MAVKAEIRNIPDMPTDPACNRLQAKAHDLLRSCARRKNMGDLIFTPLRKFRSGTTEQEAYMTGLRLNQAARYVPQCMLASALKT